MKKILLLFTLIFLMISCGDDCYNPPQPILFEITDGNKNNLLTNGTLAPYSVTDEDMKMVPLTTTDDGKLLLENVGAFEGSRKFQFKSSVRNFDFTVESKKFDTGCTGFQIKKLTFTGIAIDIEDQNGFYRIIFN